MKDDVCLYNHARWEALAKANALFTRPKLDLEQETARDYLGLDRLGVTCDVSGKNVLCQNVWGHERGCREIKSAASLHLETPFAVVAVGVV